MTRVLDPSRPDDLHVAGVFVFTTRSRPDDLHVAGVFVFTTRELLGSDRSQEEFSVMSHSERGRDVMRRITKLNLTSGLTQTK